ncbi:MAG: hypothetical protein ACR5LG_13045 [Sodalis sp. (in: enterobacteria)]|uniref:hypothetical protein n=1 Tax=Sodalis sp. (in: enterobacteria) TaxID=1898979 RepID=UPI003F36492E
MMTGWDIEVDADLLTPAAGWAFSVGLSQARLPPRGQGGRTGPNCVPVTRLS